MAELTQPIVIDGIELAIKTIRGITFSYPDKPEWEEGFGDCLKTIVEALESLSQSAAGPPLTNADKLRNMTDEELADWLMKLDVFSCDQIDFCQCKEWCIENISNIPREHCRQCLLEWLKEGRNGGNRKKRVDKIS